MARILLVCVLAAGQAGCDGCEGGAPSAPPMARSTRAPNVVLVIGCTLRADQTSLYGGPDDTTPFLASAAARGVHFTEAIAASPWTRPSVAAIVTGHHALSLGLTEPGPARNERALPDDAETMAERMQRLGYQTVGVTSNPNLNTPFGFHQGFDVYHDSIGWNRGAKRSGIEVVEDAVGVVSDRQSTSGDKPFFLQLVLLDPHLPNTATEEQLESFKHRGVTDRVAAYRAQVRQLDAAVAALESKLARLGIVDTNTLFVVIGDHGEGLESPRHHGNGHGNYLFPSVAHVPWVMWGTGTGKAHPIGGLASQVDVVPTLLGVLGARQDYTGPGLDWSAQVAGSLHHTSRTTAFIDTWFKASNRAAFYTRERLCQHDFDPTERPRAQPTRNPKPTFHSGCFDRATDPSFVRVTADPVAVGQLHEWRQQRLAERAAFLKTP